MSEMLEEAVKKAVPRPTKMQTAKVKQEPAFKKPKSVPETSFTQRLANVKAQSKLARLKRPEEEQKQLEEVLEAQAPAKPIEVPKIPKPSEAPLDGIQESHQARQDIDEASAQVGLNPERSDKQTDNSIQTRTEAEASQELEKPKQQKLKASQKADKGI